MYFVMQPQILTDLRIELMNHHPNLWDKVKHMGEDEFVITMNRELGVTLLLDNIEWQCDLWMRELKKLGKIVLLPTSNSKFSRTEENRDK